MRLARIAVLADVCCVLIFVVIGRASHTKGESVAGIAREILGLETLDTRNSDSLDFSEQAVWTLKAALEAAYAAGLASAKN